MFFNYILRLVCHLNIFFMVPSNNKRKLLVNNQNLEKEPLKEKLLFKKKWIKYTLITVGALKQKFLTCFFKETSSEYNILNSVTLFNLLTWADPCVRKVIFIFLLTSIIDNIFLFTVNKKTLEKGMKYA